MNSNKFLFLLLLFVSPLYNYAQSPWVKAPKEGYTQLGYSSIGKYNKLYFDGDNEIALSRDVSETSIDSYTEYGIKEKYSLELKLPFRMVDAKNSQLPGVENASNAGIGNIEIGLKRNLYNKNFLITGFAQVRMNTNLAGDEGALRVGYDSWGIRPGVSIGKGWNKFYSYGFASYEIRTNNMSNIIRAGAEFGFRIYKEIFIAQFIEWQGSQENGDGVTPGNDFTGLYVDDQEFFTGTIKAIIGINEKVGGYIASTNFAMNGNFVPKKAAVGAGVYYKWK